MPAAGHKIADAVFNFTFASADETVRGAAVLPGLIKTQLVPCMDDVFDRWGTHQDVVRIDRLAVDLGYVAYEDMARALARRLEQALHAALQKRPAADHPPGTNTVRRIPPHQAGLDLIAHYLRTGTVPWTAEKFSPAELNRILATLIDQAPQILLAFLQSQTGKAGPVLPRLTRQFNPDLLLRLAARLTPAAAPTLSRLVNAFAALQKAAASAPVSGREWVGALWEGILRQLLMPGGRSMSPHTLVANALQAGAARSLVSRSRLFHYLTPAWQGQRVTAAGIEAEILVAEVLGRLDPEGAAHEAPLPTADQWTPLKSGLLDALLHDRMDGFSRAWPVMVTCFAGATRQVIRQTARQAQVRRTIARRFTPRQFRQLVVLLEPRHARFINNVLEHQKTLGQAMPRASTPPETMGVHLREFTLAYLLSEGATRFNRKQYCAGMIRRLAARHNMAYEALLEDIHTFFSSAIAVHDDTGRQLKEILEEIRGRPIATQNPLPEDHLTPPGIPRDLPSRMRAGLRQGRTSAKQHAASGHGAYVMLIGPAQHCPATSAALVQGLDPEETPAPVASDRPLPQEIREVLGGGIGLSGLTAALKRLAGRHPHWSRFLSHALLEMGRDLDPSDLIQHLIGCLQKAGGATATGAFYQELCRELAAVGTLPQAADEPSRVSETACRQNPSENQLMASDRPLPREIREVLAGGTGLSGLTAALKRLAGRHPHWSRFLSHALLEMGRDLDPAVLIQHLIGCLQKAGGVTATGAFYQELCRELAFVGTLPQAADEPSRVSETACRQSPSENQTMASDRPLPREIREVLAGGIGLSGLTAALKRLAGRHPHWSRFLSHALLEMGRDQDPADLIQHLIRCLQKAGGATATGAFYQELCRELAFVGTLPQAADEPSRVSETACRQNPSKNQLMASDRPLTREIREVLGGGIGLSGLTAALERLAARHLRWSKLLIHVLLEIGRDLDPADLIRYLGRCLKKADGATAPGVFYNELRRELAAGGPLPPAADEPSRGLETACCPSPSKNQLSASDRPLPQEIREVLGGGTGLSGLAVALERLAARHPRWSKFLSNALLKVDRDLDPAALMQHLRRCLEKADGETIPGAFYRELRRELSAGRSRTHDAGGPPAQLAGGRRSERETAAPVSSQSRWIWREPEAAGPDQSVFVQNAGLVLVAPYLPRFFGMLDLTVKNRFNNHPAAERAIHLLEFIANERTAAPEFQLVLNKVLCGVAVSRPITPGIDITPKEKSAVNSLIRGIIDNWKILGNTSPEGLRAAFLQREGYLTLKDDTWHLQVEERSYDMLLDRLPWSYAVIKHPWMTRMLHVHWRSS